MNGNDVKAFRESLPKPHSTVEGFARVLGVTRQTVWNYQSAPPGYIRALITFASSYRDKATHAELVELLGSLRNGSE